jgi:hypothetical protein
VGDLMLGWTLGGYPSPNLEVVGRVLGGASPEAALQQVAERRFGRALAPAVVMAWREFSTAFGEFPYHIDVVYQGPQQLGPANLLWATPTGYRATMTGFPYDDLERWRGIYPAEVFAAQMEKVAAGFERAVSSLKAAARDQQPGLAQAETAALRDELAVAEAAAMHFRSTADQARFVLARDRLAAAKTAEEARAQITSLERVLTDEVQLARRLHELQSGDSRLGFEAANHYFYVPVDLAEKVINCRDLLDRWLPAQRERWGLGKS